MRFFSKQFEMHLTKKLEKNKLIILSYLYIHLDRLDGSLDGVLKDGQVLDIEFFFRGFCKKYLRFITPKKPMRHKYDGQTNRRAHRHKFHVYLS